MAMADSDLKKYYPSTFDPVRKRPSTFVSAYGCVPPLAQVAAIAWADTLLSSGRIHRRNFRRH